jgi:hypothetical protein
MDREAYRERCAIMDVNKAPELTYLDISRDASDMAYKTRFSRVCTDAANGDWTAAETWMKEIRERFGVQTATDVLTDIWATIDEELRWRR